MQGHALLPVERAEPELVRGPGADFGNEQQRRQLGREAADGLDGGRSVLQGQDVFALEFLAVAGREFVAEMRQPVQPRAGFVQLHRAVFAGHSGQGVPGFHGRGGAEEFGQDRLGVEGLEPHLADGVAGVIGEEADAVGAGDQGREVCQGPVPRQVFQDPLPHLKARPHGQFQAGDDAQGTEAHHAAQELVPVLAGQGHLLAGGADQVDAFDGAGQGGVLHARAVRPGLDGAGHRDMWQGGEVVDRDAGLFQRAAQSSVADTAADPDGLPLRVQLDFLRQGVQEDVNAVGIAYAVERVPRSECFYPAGAGHHLGEPGH